MIDDNSLRLLAFIIIFFLLHCIIVIIFDLLFVFCCVWPLTSIDE